MRSDNIKQQKEERRWGCKVILISIIQFAPLTKV